MVMARLRVLLIGEVAVRVEVGGDALGGLAQLIGAHPRGDRGQIRFGLLAGGLIDRAR
jgi:hypothetical protein